MVLTASVGTANGSLWQLESVNSGRQKTRRRGTSRCVQTPTLRIRVGSSEGVSMRESRISEFGFCWISLKYVGIIAGVVVFIALQTAMRDFKFKTMSADFSIMFFEAWLQGWAWQASFSILMICSSAAHQQMSKPHKARLL